MTYTVWARDAHGRDGIIVAGLSRSAAESVANSLCELLSDYEGVDGLSWIEED